MIATCDADDRLATERAPGGALALALLTGRNRHRAGFGSIAEYPRPFPGYTAARPRTCIALPRILRDN